VTPRKGWIKVVEKGSRAETIGKDCGPMVDLSKESRKHGPAHTYT